MDIGKSGHVSAIKKGNALNGCALMITFNPPCPQQGKERKRMTGERDMTQEEMEINHLRLEVEQLRVQLAGCGVAAMCNTHKSREEQKCVEGDYGWSQSYQDVVNAVGREIALREENERLKAEIKAIMFKSIGWAHADACVTLDNGGDPRKTTVPDMLARAKIDFDLGIDV